METVIIAISCFLTGALAGALIITHPITARRMVTIPSGDIDLIKAQIAALEAKVTPAPAAPAPAPLPPPPSGSFGS